MNYKRLGDYIQLVDKRNKDLVVTKVCGLSMEKYFIPSIANTNTVDLSNYKIVEKGQFGLILMKVGRDNKVSAAILEGEEAVLISPAYYVFEIIDKTVLLPDFLMIWLLRPENDRWLGFISVSSIRGSITFEEFGDTQLPIPNIETQKKYVALYKGLLNNQKVYENSLDDLQLICDTYMDTLKNIENQQPLGELVELVDNRNSEDKVKKLLGINVNKVFMPSKANVTESNLSKYKIIQKGQFAYSAMQVGRDETVRVVLYSFNEPAIISPAYSVFQVKDNDVVFPEFLMLCFYRPEFNRYGWFISDSSVRASLEWERFTDIKLPIPDIKIQEAIVTIYHTLETRKRINEQLKASIKPLCPVLMRGVVEEMEIYEENIL
jgi:type I restriction enzyme S subunit